MLTTMIRTVIIYFFVLLVIRIMGKSELSNMSPFQMVIMFMIAELATMAIESDSLALLTGISAIFTLLFLQVALSYAGLKSERFKNFINGRPSLLIENGRINHHEMKELRISIADLVEQLRLGGASSICDVDFAIMEANGDMTIVLKPEKEPLTPAHLDMEVEMRVLPMVIVSDGYFCSTNLSKVHIKKEDFEKAARQCGFTEISDIFLAYADENKGLHFFRKEDDCDTISEVQP